MKRIKVYLVGVLTSVLFGTVCLLSGNTKVIITDNIEALSTAYEWNRAPYGYWIPVEMGNAPSQQFLQQYPNYSYSIAPEYTNTSTVMNFYNLGTGLWEQLSQCYESSDPGYGWGRTILNGNYCFCHYGEGTGVDSDTRGNRLLP